jgi:hypothetical protein
MRQGIAPPGRRAEVGVEQFTRRRALTENTRQGAASTAESADSDFSLLTSLPASTFTLTFRLLVLCELTPMINANTAETVACAE